MDSKRRYPWMRHAAAEDNELENKSDVWKVTTHTHTHTHLCSRNLSLPALGTLWSPFQQAEKFGPGSGFGWLKFNGF